MNGGGREWQWGKQMVREREGGEELLLCQGQLLNVENPFMAMLIVGYSLSV